VEDRTLPQNPEIRVQGRAVAATHRIALGESHRHLLRRRVADLLVDDAPSQPATAPTVALTQLELQLLDQLAPDRKASAEPHTLANYIVKIARLGGYLARARDPAPGNIVMWRDLARLTDIAIGYSLRVQNMGN